MFGDVERLDYIKALDAEILDRLRELLQSPLSDLMFFAVFAASFLGLFWLVVSFLFAFRKKSRFIFFGVLIALVFGFLVSLVLFKLPQRTAAYISCALFDMTEIIPVKFPSFSTVMAFSSLVVLVRHCRGFSAVFIVLACFVPLSHLYFGLCYPIDVIISVIAGLLSGYLAEQIVLKIAPTGAKVK